MHNLFQRFRIVPCFLIPLSILLTFMGIYNIMKTQTNDSVLRLIRVIILMIIPIIGFLFYRFIGIKKLKV
jgi:cytochrome c biogenesis protein CcdA